MHESFLKDIALVLGVAALTSSIFFKARLPSVLGYLIAGFIIGPYIPIPLFADPHRVESLSEFGVILVMFSIGMEFSLGKFFRVLPTSGVTAALEVGGMFMIGLSVGYLFEWSATQSIFMGGALAISSTMIVSKIFEEHQPTEKTREHVLGVLVIQDVVAILLLTILGAFAASKQLNLTSLLPTVSRLIFTLVLLTVIGLFIVPKFIKYVSSLKNTEVLIIVATGLCFVLALIVESLGYSVALGAFLAGILVAESGEGTKIERLAKPLKDVFVAIFFVSVGMTVDPVVAFEVLPQSLLVSLAVVVAQFLVVFLGSVLSGTGLNRALFSSLALGQIGEFSFIIAAIGAGAGMVSKDFQAIVVTVSILTSLSTPILWRNAEKIVNTVSKRLPNQFRIAVGLYEAWFNRIRESKIQDGRIMGIPKKVIFGLLLDVFLLILIPPLFFKYLPSFLNQLGIPDNTMFESLTLITLLGVVLAPVIYGFTKMSSVLIIKLSQAVFSVSLDENPQQSQAERLFNLTMWSILCLIVSFPFFVSVSFFLESSVFLTLVLLILFTIFFRLWKSAGKVAFEYEAGGERLLSVIKKQTYSKSKKSVKTNPMPPRIPGLEDLDSIEIINAQIVGKSLAELDIRNLTGVTVVSISRGESLIMFPSHTEVVCMNDTLHVWGSEKAKIQCQALLNNTNSQH